MMAEALLGLVYYAQRIDGSQKDLIGECSSLDTSGCR